MTSRTTPRERPDPRREARDRGDARAHLPVAAPHARWLKLGLAGALGFVAGAMMFPGRAEGAPRRRP